MAQGGVRAIGEPVVCHEPYERTYCHYLRPWTYGEVIGTDGVDEHGVTIYRVRRAPDPRRRMQCLEQRT